MSTEQFRFKGRTEGADDWTEWLDRYVDGEDQIEYDDDDEYLEYEHRTVGVDGSGGGFILSPLDDYRPDLIDPVANVKAAMAYIKGTYGAVGAPSSKDIVTDPKTGGQKGRKAEQHSLVPAWPQDEIARVYGFGATLYDAENWRRGYAWSLSISALMRHVQEFRQGATVDHESGYHPLAHAAFHLCTLMEFERLGLGTDDRGDVRR